MLYCVTTGDTVCLSEGKIAAIRVKGLMDIYTQTLGYTGGRVQVSETFWRLYSKGNVENSIRFRASVCFINGESLNEPLSTNLTKIACI